MSLVELSNQYMRLRADLASAYGEPVWNSQHIDSLTDAIADTEFALASNAGASAFVDSARYALPSAVGTTVARF